MLKHVPTSAIVPALLGVLLGAGAARAEGARPLRQPPALHRVHSLHITMLSTMLADRGVGEWGLTRRTAVVAAVGSSFDLDRGIDPLALAQ